MTAVESVMADEKTVIIMRFIKPEGIVSTPSPNDSTGCLYMAVTVKYGLSNCQLQASFHFEAVVWKYFRA